jgi:di/tricarboxylate transporter
MTWEAWVTLGTTGMVLYGLWRNLASPDVLLMGGALMLTALSTISPAFPTASNLAANFGNEGVLTVAALFVVAAGLTETGGMSLVTDRLLGRPTSELSAQIRLIFPVAGMSAFLNNTPVVAVFIPVINDWGKKTGISPSKLLLPLSYAAILGGVCTLIGTSTNLVVQAMLVEARKTDPSVEVMQLFTLTPVGGLVCIAGLGYLLVASRFLLPTRRTFRADVEDPRQYTVEMLVQPGSAIDGQTIEGAGLRHLPRAYLSVVERDDEPIVAVRPDHVLRGNDRLVFVGVVESVVELQRIRGLVPATDQVLRLSASRLNRLLVEVIVSEASPMVGKTIREGRFRNRYDAAVIAVYRHGERLTGKIGDIRVRAGDALLLQAHSDFARKHRDDRDFLLVSALEGTRPIRHERAWVAMTIMTIMILVASTEELHGISIFQASLLGAGAMGLFGCISAEHARRSVDIPVLTSIVAALLIGQAMAKTGLAADLAAMISRPFDQLGPWAVLGGIYFLTLLFTELVTNNAAAALAFPIARAAADTMDVNFMPFAIVVAIAASSGFATPLGYQTHLMVYGPGGYRFSDFMRMGLPLDALCMIITVAVTPLFYPFYV